MPIENVNATQQNKNTSTQTAIYTAAGLGTGAIAGGTFGYYQRPWIKNEDISDTFVKNVTEKELKLGEEDCKVLISDLKKIAASGSLENTQDSTKAYFKGLSNSEVIKTLSNNILDGLKKEFGDGILDGKYDKYRETVKFSPEDMSEQKERIKNLFDIKNKKLKPLDKNADLDDLNLHTAVKEIMSNLDKKNALKWGGIGAAILGIAGLGASFIANSKSSSATDDQQS